MGKYPVLQLLKPQNLKLGSTSIAQVNFAKRDLLKICEAKYNKQESCLKKRDKITSVPELSQLEGKKCIAIHTFSIGTSCRLHQATVILGSR